jgi:DNA-binding CsgD family transcriptional regulator
VSPSSLIGRRAELERLDEALRTIDERGTAVLVVGEPGIGKTALITEAARLARDRGMLVLAASGLLSEAHLPYAGLHQLLRPVLKAAEELPGPQRAALLGAFGQVDEPVTDPAAVAMAALSLLRDRSWQAPVVVAAEDVHWLDRATVEVLTFVANKIQDDRIVLIASCRDNAEIVGDPRFAELRVEGLDEDSSRAIVAAYAPALDSRLRERLLAEANGNPLALVELAVAWGALPAGTPIEHNVPLTGRLKDAFSERISALPDACQQVLLIAAVNDSDSVAEALAAAEILGAGPVSVGELEPAVRARLVELDGQQIRFRHALVRSAVEETSAFADRQLAHGALAAAIGDPIRAVWHRAAAVTVRDETIALALDDVATNAQRRGAIMVAITALERAASLTPDPAGRGRRLVRAAHLAFGLGRIDVMQRLLGEAETLALDPVGRARLAWQRLLLGDQAWAEDQVRSLVDLTRQLTELGEIDTALEGLMAVAITAWWTNFDSARRQLIAEAVEAIPVRDDDPRVLSILGFAAPLERGAVVLDRLTGIRPEAIEDPEGLSNLGMVAGFLGAQDESAAYLDTSILALRKQGRLGALASALTSRAWTAWNSGSWNVATSAAEEARRLGEQIDRPIIFYAARLAGSAVAAAKGDARSAEAAADEVERFFLPLGGVPMLALASLVRGVDLLAQGRNDEAFDRLWPMFDTSRGATWTIANQGAVSPFVDAAAATGHVAEARSVIERIEQIARRSGDPTLAASVLYAYALLADEGEAEAAFSAAMESDLQRWPFMYARLLFARGTWLRRQRRLTESRAPLRAARDAFDALPAIPWGERARRELRASGESSRRRVSDPAERLTPQELEIASLVGQGMTNREVGQQLYLSPRTVGSHLYRIFPKLGITTRAQLGVAMAGSSAVPT